MAYTQGKRGQPDEHGWLRRALEPGEYVFVNPTAMADGSPLPDWVKKHYPCWIVETPNGHGGSLANHTIVEHPDGTITVSPSILIFILEGPPPPPGQPDTRPRKELYHGYLEKGVWRDCRDPPVP